MKTADMTVKLKSHLLPLNKELRNSIEVSCEDQEKNETQ
jgi:hypothetical protein